MKSSCLPGVCLLAALSWAGCGAADESYDDVVGSSEEGAFEPSGDDAVGSSTEAICAGPGGHGVGLPCTSTAECPAAGVLRCSTEFGVCKPPPGCDPRFEICPAVCFGNCVPVHPAPPVCPRPQVCGPALCFPGTECCNPLLGICVPPGGVCAS